jgi:hypothetical protein
VNIPGPAGQATQCATALLLERHKNLYGLIPKPNGELMTLLTQRPEASSSTTETTLKAPTASTVADTAVRGGSYVTLPAGSVTVGVAGSYVTVAGTRNLPPVSRGSYVTVGGTPVVAASVIEGSYVTLPSAA